MRYKHMENANVDVSELALGTWALGGERYGDVDYTEATSAVHAMIDSGVNLVDTAAYYGNGASEKFVGDALQGGYRDRVLISTKCASQRWPGHTLHDASFRRIISDVESSLYNLKTDHIDFYFVHWPDPATPLFETMSALNVLKKQGKIRFIGLSNHSREQVEEAMKWGQIDVIQPPYCMVDREQEDLMKWAATQGISSFTYGSMGAGVLSGRYRGPVDFAENDYRLAFYDYFHEPKYGAIQKLLRVMDEIAAEHSCPVSHVALNWCAQKPFVSCALVGVRTVAHARENCAAFDWRLAQDELETLDKAIERFGL